MRRTRIAVNLCLALLLVAGAALAQSDMGNDQQRARGQELYDKYCAQCHNENGDGLGYAWHRVRPEPRDFISGSYKFRTTPSGMMPTDADLYRTIKEGLPYTSMPGWPQFNDTDIQNIIYHLKTFSEDFRNPDKTASPINIPEPPEMTEESVARGTAVFEDQGCPACHGNLGRGDGPSVRTLVNDAGFPLRSADMTQRWTFRGGPTRKDIFKTFSTGLNGTPMPSYADSLAVEDRWDLVNYIYSLGDGDDPNYEDLLIVKYVDDELNLAEADELFENAPAGRFPLVGQIVEPGRNFYPTTTSVVVQAVYNRKEIAFRVRWNNMSQEATGSNGPLVEVPPWDEDNPVAVAATDEDEGGFWGDEVEEDEDEGGFWGEEEEGEEVAAGFSDAVALQFPSVLPPGNRKPYFIYGDVQNSVDLWFVSMARGWTEQYIGRGSGSLELSEADEFETVAAWDEGRWTVIYKRSLGGSGGVTFAPGLFVPLAFSVWDGFNNERGNKRALSPWFYLYVEPGEIVSPVGPMFRAALIALVVELVLVFYVRRRFAAHSVPTGPVVPENA